MALSIVDAVATIKRSVAECLTAESIHRACRQAGHTWRERELGPAQTIWAFVLQVLHGNTACAHVVRLARLGCSAAAYCSARARLPLAVCERILQQTSQAAQQSFRAPLWRGHRTFYVDGTGFSMPDTKELRDHFGQSARKQRGQNYLINSSDPFVRRMSRGSFWPLAFEKISCRNWATTCAMVTEQRERVEGGRGKEQRLSAVGQMVFPSPDLRPLTPFHA